MDSCRNLNASRNLVRMRAGRKRIELMPKAKARLRTTPVFELQRKLAFFEVQARTKQFDADRHWFSIGMPTIIALGVLGALVYFVGPVVALIVVAIMLLCSFLFSRLWMMWLDREVLGYTHKKGPPQMSGPP